MRIITGMCNIQRDKYLSHPEWKQKKKVRRGSGFDQILRKEESKINDVQESKRSGC